MDEEEMEAGAPAGKSIRERVQKLEERAHNFGQRAREGAHELRERASAYQEGANEFLDSMALYIRENPQRSAIIAAGVGVGVGVILGMMIRGGRG